MKIKSAPCWRSRWRVECWWDKKKGFILVCLIFLNADLGIRQIVEVNTLKVKSITKNTTANNPLIVVSVVKKITVIKGSRDWDTQTTALVVLLAYNELRDLINGSFNAWIRAPEWLLSHLLRQPWPRSCAHSLAFRRGAVPSVHPPWGPAWLPRLTAACSHSTGWIPPSD